MQGALFNCDGMKAKQLELINDIEGVESSEVCVQHELPELLNSLKNRGATVTGMDVIAGGRYEVWYTIDNRER